MKAHLSVLLGLLALVKAAGYWLQRYDLTVSTRGFVDGAGYTDVKAQLPAINLLLLISIASFVLFIVNIWRRGWTLPILGVGLWALVAVVAGAIYPQFVQRFQVEPNEPEKERPYIERNIEATQAAMGLGTIDVEEVPFDLETDKDNIDLAANAGVGAEHPHLGPVAGGARQDLPAAAARPRLLPDQRRRRRPLRARTATPTQVVLSVRDLNTGQRAPRHVGGQAPHLHPRLRRGRRAGQRQGGRAASRDFVAKDVPVRQRRRPSSSSTQPAVYFGEELARLRRHGHEAAGARLPGGRGHAVRRLRGRRRRDARQPVRSGPPSRCASATSTR